MFMILLVPFKTLMLSLFFPFLFCLFYRLATKSHVENHALNSANLWHSYPNHEGSNSAPYTLPLKLYRELSSRTLQRVVLRPISLKTGFTALAEAELSICRRCRH